MAEQRYGGSGHPYWCHICQRQRDQWERLHDLQVAMRNGFFVYACQRCWFMWPDEHKTWPVIGFGRMPAAA